MPSNGKSVNGDNVIVEAEHQRLFATTNVHANEAQIKTETDDNFFANHINWRTAVPQILASCIVLLIVIQAGINMAYTSIILPQLNQTDSSIQVTRSESTWIASIVTICLPIGSIIVGPLADRFGRKRIALFACIPFIIGWNLMYFATNVFFIYVARVFGGIGAGLTTVAVIYVSEITHPKLRAMLLGLNVAFTSFGILLTSILGQFFEWRIIAAIFSGFTVLTFMIITIIPESPHWLAVFQSKQTHAIETAVQWIYTSKDRRQYEMRTIRATISQGQSSKSTDAIQQTTHTLWKYMAQANVYRPFIVLVFLFFFQQITGIYAIIFYAVNLCMTIGTNNDGINEYTAMLLINITRFVFIIINVIYSKHHGRRKLLHISGLGMSLSSLLVALCMHGDANKILILTFVLSFVGFGSLGVITIPWTLVFELLPTEVKGKLGGLLVSIAYVVMFGVVKMFPYIMEYLGAANLFYMFAFNSLCGVVFTYIYVPETLGKTFQEISEFFTSKHDELA